MIDEAHDVTTAADYQYKGGRLAANVALGALSAGAATIAATGLLVPALIVGALGGGVTYLITNQIPKIGSPNGKSER